MAEHTIAKALGLYTSGNPLTLPEGAFTLATNAVIDLPDRVSMRPGFHDTGMTAMSGGEVPTAAEVFQSYLVFQHATSKISRFPIAGGSRTEFSQTFTPPSAPYRMRFAQAGG